VKVLIFGASRLAGLAWYVLTHDSPHEVVGFTVDGAYLTTPTKNGLPVVAFENLESVFVPGETAFIAPVGFSVMKGLAAARTQEARARGYPPITYISSRALTWPDLVIGEGCMIFDGVTVEPFARIGDNTIVRAACHLSHDATIGGSCYLAPRAAVAGSVTIGERCFIGAGALVLDRVRIAPGCFIAAGARVARDTEEDGVYEGAPAVRRAVPASRLRRL
jgi:sugar O-acyltransferase (sialic acid O-acetyltransferase NeuD family)